MILHKTKTASTNADILALARDGAADGTWVYADTQSGGRGRQGRAWVSPAGNLYASGLVRLREGDPAAASLALVAGVAVWDLTSKILSPVSQRVDVEGRLIRGDTIVDSDSPSSNSGLRGNIQLKWPNDLLINTAKLAGILLEREGDAVVLGVGLNLSHHPDLPDRPATSLAAQGMTPPTPAEAIVALAECTTHWLDVWRTQGLPTITAAWMARAHVIGTPLFVDTGHNEHLYGSFAGLTTTGALILRLADGTESVIHAGDVFLV
jgi:BirA family biotin operon repressor/biotin-[acetyl-CoA-carboxylase] ligase